MAPNRHLQTNKVKYIVDKVSLIHSVDRIELAREIQKRAESVGKTVDVLVQVNVSGEKSKFVFLWTMLMGLSGK